MRRWWVGAALVVLVCAAAGAAWWSTRPSPEAQDDDEGPRAPPPPADARAAPSGPHPNVVVVIGCTVRKDQVSPYGGSPLTTPFLTEMSERGAWFSDAITAAPWTRAASTAIVTGHHFRTIGMSEPGRGTNHLALAPEVATMAEHFHDAGYHTIGAAANPNLNKVFGFGQGFDQYWEATDLYRDGGAKVPGRRVVDRVLSQIDQRADDRPVFASMILLDAHSPAHGIDPVEAAEFARGEVPLKIGRYRAILNRFDRAVERLWHGLNDRGFDASNTVLLFVNDHGEGLSWPNPAQGFGHGRFLRGSTVGMSWFVRGAGVARGHRIDGLASQIDVLPTVLGIAGLPVPGTLPGRDWSRLVAGDGARTDLEAAFVDTDMGGSDRSAIYTSSGACLVDRREGSQQCFDRTTDPLLLGRPLSAVDADLLAKWKAWRDDVEAQAAAWPHTTHAFPSREERRMLQALGYTEEDEP